MGLGSLAAAGETERVLIVPGLGNGETRAFLLVTWDGAGIMDILRFGAGFGTAENATFGSSKVNVLFKSTSSVELFVLTESSELSADFWLLSFRIGLCAFCLIVLNRSIKLSLDCSSMAENRALKQACNLEGAGVEKASPRMCAACSLLSWGVEPTRVFPGVKERVGECGCTSFGDGNKLEVG